MMSKKRIAVLILVFCMACLSNVVRCKAQATSSPEEYALFEKASQEKDNAAKQALLLEFVQKYPKSTLDPNIAYEYAKLYIAYREKGSWQQIATAAEKFLQYRNTDQSSIVAATEAYQKLGVPQKLADFGAKLYAQTPNANTAYFVAKAYQSLKDGPKFLKWAELTIKHDPNNIEMLVELITVHWQSQNFPQTSNYGQKALQAVQVAKKPEGVTDEQWATKISQVRGFAHGAIGEAAYTSNDLATALKNFEAAAKANKKYDFAHYRLGFIYWRGGRTDEACMSFAKAFVLDGPASPDAKNQLYNLYKSTRGNTTGIPALIQQAREAVK
jgi:tetratricopeptide (TPR) repeat protein